VAFVEGVPTLLVFPDLVEVVSGSVDLLVASLLMVPFDGATYGSSEMSGMLSSMTMGSNSGVMVRKLSDFALARAACAMVGKSIPNNEIKRHVVACRTIFFIAIRIKSLVIL
jgi:hypothetical protein